MLEMGLTPKVFDDVLPQAALPYQINAYSLEYVLSHKNRRVEIKLKPSSDRKIGGLTLPVTFVELSFFEHSQEQKDAFMLRFKRYFHRGGG